MLVKDVMSERKITISPDSLLTTAARKMRNEDIGCLMVEKKGQLQGIVTDRDITCRGLASNQDCSKMHVSDVMTDEVVWCAEEEDVEDALRIMEQMKVRRLPVVAEGGNTVGMLSVGDISTHLSHELSGEVIEAVSTPDDPSEKMAS